MKRNIGKLVAVGIALSVISGNILPAFAVETESISNNSITNVQAPQNEKKLLTAKISVDSVIENSDKLSLKSKQIKLYRDKLKLQEKLDDVNEDPFDEDFPYDKLELQKDQIRQEKDFLQDQIENDITNKYNDIVLREIEINKINKTLEIKEKDIKNMQLKKQLGLTTGIETQGKEIEIQTLKDKKKAKEDLLKVKKEYLGVLTELNLEEYIFNHNIEYTPFKIEKSIDNYIDDKIDQYLKYNEEMIGLTSDYVDDMEDVVDEDPNKPEENPPKQENFKNEDGSENKVAYDKAKAEYDIQLEVAKKKYLGKLNSYGGYLDAKYNLDSSEVTLDETRKNLKNGLKESYSTLLDLENQINTTNQQIELANKKLGHAKLQYELGLITLNDYNTQVLQSEDLDTALRNLVNNHNVLENNIQKPWLFK